MSMYPLVNIKGYWYAFPALAATEELIVTSIFNLQTLLRRDTAWHKHYSSLIVELRRSLGIGNVVNNILAYIFSEQQTKDCELVETQPTLITLATMGTGALYLATRLISSLMKNRPILPAHASRRFQVIRQSLIHTFDAAGSVSYLLELIYSGCKVPAYILFPSQFACGYLGFNLSLFSQGYERLHASTESNLQEPSWLERNFLLLAHKLHEVDLFGGIENATFLINFMFDIIVSIREALSYQDPTDIPNGLFYFSVVALPILIAIETMVRVAYPYAGETLGDKHGVESDPGSNSRLLGCFGLFAYRSESEPITVNHSESIQLLPN